MNINKYFSKENLTKENIKNVIIIILAIALIISISQSCNKSKDNSITSNDNAIVKIVSKDTYYKNITIGELYLKDNITYTNVIIPIYNNGDKDITDFNIYYDFLDYEYEVLSQELNDTRGRKIKTNDSLELVSSYSLDDVYGIKIKSFEYKLEDGTEGYYELEEPIIFKIDK